MTAIALLLVALALIGVPLFAVFGAAAILLFGTLPDTSVTGAANDVFSEKFADSPLLVTIPLFTFAGYLMAESGTPRRLVALSRAWLGWLPGGLAVVCLAASAFFTTFTGGSGITIVAIGGLLYPALLADRYPKRYSLGLVTTGGSLGLLFPPSLPLVLYGVVAGVLIEKLFLAGLLPGLLTVTALAVHAFFEGRKIPRQESRFDLRRALAALEEAKWEVALPLLLLGGLYGGVLRIHEAAALTAFYVLMIEVFVYRDVHPVRDLPRIVREATTLVGAILVILATAIGFTAYLIQAEVPSRLLDSVTSAVSTLTAHVPLAKEVWFLILLNGFLLIVGMLMDVFSAIVVVVPLITPLAREFGIDPYHLGIIFLLNLEIGYLTPPVGLNLFISSFRFREPVTSLYGAVLPFIAVLLFALLVTTYVPTLSSWLPHALFPQDDLVLEPVPPSRSGGAVDDPPEPTLDTLDLQGTGDDEVLDLDALERELGQEAAPDVIPDAAGIGAEPGAETLDDLERELGNAPP